MGMRIINDGFSDVHVFIVVGTSGFPNTEFSMTWRVKAIVDRNDYQTYTCVASLAFGGGNEYWTAADFNSPNMPHIGSDGSDTLIGNYGSPLPGVFKRMAFQRLDLGGGTIQQRWWPDLDKSKNLFVTRNDTNGISYASDARFCIGNVPYTTNEGCDAIFDAVKLWAAPKNIDDLDQESMSGDIVLPGGATNLWGQWPMTSNANDISGNARHLTIELQGAGGSPAPSDWLTFDGIPPPGFAVAKNLRRFTMPYR